MRPKRYLKQFEKFFKFIENECKINLKDENENENDFESGDESERITEKGTNNKITKSIEERLWITLLLSISLLTLFLIITDQKHVLDREISVFKASQAHLYNELNHIFTGKRTEEPEYKNLVQIERVNNKDKAEADKEKGKGKEATNEIKIKEDEDEDEDDTNRIKYDQFAARKEFQIDWNSLINKTTIKDSKPMEAQLQEIVTKIQNEQDKIRDLKKQLDSLKKPIPASNSQQQQQQQQQMIANKPMNPFSDLKELRTFIKQTSNFNINRIQTPPTTSTSQSTLIKNLNFSYARIIRRHFSRQLEIPETDLKSPISLSHQYIQQLKFLVSIQAALDALPELTLDTKILQKQLSKLKTQILVHLHTHHQPLTLLSSSLNSLFNSLIRKFDDIPAYPVAKSDNHKLPSGVLLMRSPSITESEAYSKIFNRLYKLNAK